MFLILLPVKPCLLNLSLLAVGSAVECHLWQKYMGVWYRCVCWCHSKNWLYEAGSGGWAGRNIDEGQRKVGAVGCWSSLG